VTGFSSKAGEVHWEEDGVGSDRGAPEVKASEGFRHQAAGMLAGGRHEREPVVDRGIEAKDAGHCHDEVEVSDDEKGVVEILIQNWLGEDWASETSGDEEADEAESEEHCGGVLRFGAPNGG